VSRKEFLEKKNEQGASPLASQIALPLFQHGSFRSAHPKKINQQVRREEYNA